MKNNFLFRLVSKICHLRIKKEKSRYPSWERFNQTLNKYITHENKIKKNINPEGFLLNIKLVIPRRSLENFYGEYYNMKDKILGFQFEPVCVKRTHLSYSDRSDLDRAETQHDRLRTQE